MILINHAAREMTAKVVYYGPGLCGKTTNLIQLHEMLPSDKKGKMLSLATKQDRTLFFDLLPVEVGKIKGMHVRIQLYTVPGQVFYDETRRLVLKGADAVVFVADSQPEMLDANRESFDNLKTNLHENGLDFDSLPIVIQYNKRDIPGVLPVEELTEKLNFGEFPSQEAVAVNGTGVKATFHAVVQLLLQKLAGKPDWAKLSPRAKPVKEEKKEAEAPEAEEAAPEPEAVVEEEAPMEIELPSSSSSLEDTSPGSEDVPIDIGGETEYDSVEEVDLTALIEERQRSTVMVTPQEEILELTPDQIVTEEDVPMDVEVVADASVEETSISKGSASNSDLQDKMDTLLVKLEDLREQISDIIKFLKD